MYKKKKTNLSIIIPAYNVEKYIEKCLESVIDQTLNSDDFEIIVIDDCSTDSTNKKIEKYVRKHSNIKCLRNDKNFGLGMSRNRGINLAKGEYVFFLDGDDYLDPRTLEDLLMKGYIENSDIVSCGIRRVEEDGSVIYKKNAYYELGSERVLLLQKLLAHKIPSMSCARLIRKSLFLENKLFFPEGLHEDVPIVYKLFVYARNVCSVEGFYYNWVQRKGSITSHVTQEHIDGLVKFLSGKSAFLRNYYGEGFYHKKLEKYHKTGLAKTFSDKLKQIYSDPKINEKIKESLIKYLYLSLHKDQEFLSAIDLSKKHYKDIFMLFEIGKQSKLNELNKLFFFYLKSPEKNSRIVLGQYNSKLERIVLEYFYIFFKIFRFVKNILFRNSYLKKFLKKKIEKGSSSISGEAAFLKRTLIRPFREEVLIVYNTREEKELSSSLVKELKSKGIYARFVESESISEEKFSFKADSVKGVIFFENESIWNQNIMVEMKYKGIFTCLLIRNDLDLKKEKLGFLSYLSYWKIPNNNFLLKEKKIPNKIVEKVIDLLS